MRKQRDGGDRQWQSIRIFEFFGAAGGSVRRRPSGEPRSGPSLLFHPSYFASVLQVGRYAAPAQPCVTGHGPPACRCDRLRVQTTSSCPSTRQFGRRPRRGRACMKSDTGSPWARYSKCAAETVAIQAVAHREQLQTLRRLGRRSPARSSGPAVFPLQQSLSASALLDRLAGGIAVDDEALEVIERHLRGQHHGGANRSPAGTSTAPSVNMRTAAAAANADSRPRPAEEGDAVCRFGAEGPSVLAAVGGNARAQPRRRRHGRQLRGASPQYDRAGVAIARSAATAGTRRTIQGDDATCAASSAVCTAVGVPPPDCPQPLESSSAIHGPWV